jgi:hypothetical protein
MALQHLRSSTADKRPTPAAMSDGQLALNTNLASPGLFFKDSNGDSVKIGPVHVGTTAPNATPGAGGQAGNSKGEAWLDTTAANPILKVFNGSAFVAVQPVGTGTVVSTTDTGSVTSTMILDGTILNADINASAAIVDTKLATIATGGKVSGTAITSGNISTSGSFTSTSTVTGTNLIPTGSGVPTNGIYLPAANSVAVATNGTGRLFVDSSGNVGLGSTPKTWSGGAIGALFNGSGSITAFSDEVCYGNNVYFNGAWRYARNDTAQLLQLGSGDVPLIFYSALTGTADAAITWSERFRLDSSGRLGIGTSSPTEALHVVGSAILTGAVSVGTTASATSLQFPAVTGWGPRIQQGGASINDFGIFTNNTEHLTVKNSGNVGIGVTTPADTLHVRGPVSGTILNLDRAGSYSWKLGQSSGSDLTFTGDTSERVRFTSDGKVLVGTSSAFTEKNWGGSGWSGKISVSRNDVDGVAQFSNWSSDSSLNSYGGTSLFISRCKSGTIGTQTGGGLASGDAIGRINFNGSDGSDFYTAAAIDVVVDAATSGSEMPGRLSFFTTADAASSPTERMRITSGGSILCDSTTIIGGDTAPLQADGKTRTALALKGGSNGFFAAFYNTSSTLIGSITGAGGATTFYNTSSDYRIKENVVPLTEAISRVNQLQVHRFNFISHPDQTVDGFIAHEAQEVVPECVTGTKDAVDADGNPVMQGIDQSKLVPLLTAALQEAIAKIESLEARLTAAGI